MSDGLAGDLRGALDFTGRLAVVTGGAKGIGLATARLLLAQGARVTVVDLDRSALERLRDKSPALQVSQADVAQEAEVRSVFDALAAAGTPADILVNNVGTGARTPSVELEAEAWSRVLAVNLTSAFLCSRGFARQAEPERGGAIVNVASIMGLVGNDLYPNLAYHASKGGLVTMTRALAVEWAPLKIRVNAVAPTFVETELTGRLLADREMRQAVLRKTPMGRLAEPEDVANAIVYLASDAARLVTGTILPVDGGWLAL